MAAAISFLDCLSADHCDSPDWPTTAVDGAAQDVCVAQKAISSMDRGMHSDTKPDNDKAAGINHAREEGVLVKREGSSDSKKVDNGPPPIAGDYSSLQRRLQGLQDPKTEDTPDELRHITDEIVPLGLLLSRLAQFSHSKLQELILSLAAKPLPEPATNGSLHGAGSSGVNGNTKGAANAHSPATEDTSAESLDKKAMILNFIQDLHSRWVKALVIAQWSEKADEVGKLIDLRTHLFEKLELYNKAFWDMVNVKHHIAFAKVPSPDLKTALEVLSKGAVHWMPDVGYNRAVYLQPVC
jgi:mediator of RNA polymerase II transcription subunit 14